MKLLLIFIISCTATLTAHAKDISGKMPDFTLESNHDKNIRLEELRGQVVMMNFWATWCGPCRQEMPALEALYKRYSKAGFTILGINIENSNNAAKKSEIERFVKEKELSFPILYDNQKQVTTTLEKQFLGKNMGMPTTVFLDRSGNARFLHEAYKPGDEAKYKKMIKALLRE
ncbi:MAG: TlpA disulfide reductase family protein [Cellvibrionaceae bacterium]